MNIKFDSIVSEFEDSEQEKSYNKWFHAKVQASLADNRPTVAHDQVLAHMRKLREERLKNANH